MNILLPWYEDLKFKVAQSCPTLCYPVYCSPPGSSVHGIFQARIMEWVAISFSRGSSQPRDWTQFSRIAGRCFNLCATKDAKDWEPPGNLTLKASGIWLQNFHRTGETDSWRAQTKPCAHQDPGERNNDPTRDWARLSCQCRSLQWKHEWTEACCGVRSTEYSSPGMSTFEGRHHDYLRPN